MNFSGPCRVVPCCPSSMSNTCSQNAARPSRFVGPLVLYIWMGCAPWAQNTWNFSSWHYEPTLAASTRTTIKLRRTCGPFGFMLATCAPKGSAQALQANCLKLMAEPSFKGNWTKLISGIEKLKNRTEKTGIHIWSKAWHDISVRVCIAKWIVDGEWQWMAMAPTTSIEWYVNVALPYRWRGADSPTPSSCNGANIDRGQRWTRTVGRCSVSVAQSSCSDGCLAAACSSLKVSAKSCN